MFAHIIAQSLKQRILVLSVACLLVVYGLWIVPKMPVDVFPNLNKPTVTLLTEAGGMAVEEVEQFVSFPIETAMNGVSGVSRVRSVSSMGLSVVYIEFAWGTDIYQNRQQVVERLNSLKQQLPADVVPQLAPVSSIMGEILLLALPADPHKVNPMQVREYADWVLRPRLMALTGVSQVIVIGGQVKQYRVEPDLVRLHSVGMSVSQLQAALENFGQNSAGGFVEVGEREYVVRHLGRSARLEDLQNIVITQLNGRPILLHQVANVSIAPAPNQRGDASFMAQSAVILSIQKQANADTLKLTSLVEKTLAEMKTQLPAGIEPAHILFKQANFIDAAIDNVQQALADGALIVALILWLFLANVRTTLISLVAIPLSLLVTALIFNYMGIGINTMTLGGLAIAMGELVDDAVVDVENVLRRLRESQLQTPVPAPLTVILAASQEVRSGIVYATFIVILVFMPLFALPSIEGRLFTPLGLAYIVSILASLLVSLTITPVLCYYLLPSMQAIHKGDSYVVRHLKQADYRLLQWSFVHYRGLLTAAAVLVGLAIASVPFLAKSFLPPFNEGTLTVSVLLPPSSSLSQSNQVAQQAERLLLSVPEVQTVGRRTGRAELDEHAEGVHSSEIDVDLKPLARSREQVMADIRQRLSVLPAVINIGQPISHRLDHLLSGVRAQIALKVFGDDLETLAVVSQQLQQRLSNIKGLTDLQVEKQVLIPQYTVRIDYQAASRYGVNAPQLLQQLEHLVQGQRIGQVIEGQRRFDLILALEQPQRQLGQLAQLLIDTPTGQIPLSYVASLQHEQGLNQIGRENGQRRLVILANTDGSDMGQIIAQINTELANYALPQGYFTRLEGQFEAQQQASQHIMFLSLISLILIFLVLYSRYQSIALVSIIMLNIPLALVGAVAALWLSGQPLSIAALVGCVTLAGIATRNGILKISHYLNLCAFEGEQFGQKMIIRGSLERLTPVLMTALVACFALVPLLLAPNEAGKEILYPVAVVIFGGLISSTLLDTLLTPIMFYLYGKPAVQRLLANQQQQAF